MKPDALIVFGRQPVAGRVKTRLAKEIGEEEACSVYRELLQKTLEAAAGVDAIRYLCLPPGDRIDPGQAFSLREQSGSDLGERMDHAFCDAFSAGHQRVVLVGSDCPYLTAKLLEQALLKLKEYETVFGPATDGGYYLLGQRTPARDLFSGIPWSTERVWELTQARLAKNNWSCSILETLEDIDDRASLKRYQTN